MKKSYLTTNIIMKLSRALVYKKRLVGWLNGLWTAIREGNSCSDLAPREIDIRRVMEEMEWYSDEFY